MLVDSSPGPGPVPLFTADYRGSPRTITCLFQVETD